MTRKFDGHSYPCVQNVARPSHHIVGATTIGGCTVASNKQLINYKKILRKKSKTESFEIAESSVSIDAASGSDCSKFIIYLPNYLNHKKQRSEVTFTIFVSSRLVHCSKIESSR